MGEYEAVYHAHHARLLKLAGLLCGDREQAEDAVAEAFARTYPRWQRGVVRDEGAYLRRAVINEVKKGSRRTSSFRASGSPWVVPSLDTMVSEHDRVWRALLTLPVRQRAAVVLRYLDDLSEAQTAEILGVPAGTVKSNVSRGLARLRTLLSEGEPDHA